jgi:ElaB/YqjD/DUF883 family membrane-anchored ribosome-binding protein
MDETANRISKREWDESNQLSADETVSETFVSDETAEQTEQIRSEIEDTRAEMGQTINEIQERLSPEHIVNQVKESVRDATIGKVQRAMDTMGEKISDVTEPAREVMGRAGNAIADSVWKNPIPLAFIGLGVGMLMMRRFGSSSSRLTHEQRLVQWAGGVNANRESESLQNEGAVSRTFQQVKETASDLASRSTNNLTALSSQAKDSATQVSNRFGELLRDNPLAVGAVAIAAGAAVGLALPSTRLEKEYIGETSGMLVDKAGQVARDAVDRVQNAAEQMTQEKTGEPSPANAPQ